ncbi:hypothetical protein DICVIV_07288 [Dictyocaulus viviparus]|uniref:Uncharacterized protein n=1 Tax=Dictyocaulus viviparus TaxID=29172 RepID=A0A0D8XS96_DICVI|nr:hypothetical protein DICVIV_07288 [Dictyocaulus viviparus]
MGLRVSAIYTWQRDTHPPIGKVRDMGLRVSGKNLRLFYYLGFNTAQIVLCESPKGHFDLLITRKNDADPGNAQSFVYEGEFGLQRDLMRDCIMQTRRIDTNDANIGTTPTFSRSRRPHRRSMSTNISQICRNPSPEPAETLLNTSNYQDIAFDQYLDEVTCLRRPLDALARKHLLHK